jgi:hypothetical protein
VSEEWVQRKQEGSKPRRVDVGVIEILKSGRSSCTAICGEWCVGCGEGWARAHVSVCAFLQEERERRKDAQHAESRRQGRPPEAQVGHRRGNVLVSACAWQVY